MSKYDLIPCHLESFFIRGEDHDPDDAIVRIDMIGKLHDQLRCIGKESMMPYVGSLFLVAMEPYSTCTRYESDLGEVMCRIVPTLDFDGQIESFEIAYAWRKNCPPGYILLPTKVATAASKIQADTWYDEIEKFNARNLQTEPVDIQL
jgi:hypothetical protein